VSLNTAELNFRFKEKVEPIRYVSGLASQMHYYDPEDVLRGAFTMTQYDAEVIGQLFQLLTPENAIVVFNDTDVATDKVSDRYQVPVAGAQLGAWRSEQNADALHLPERNQFIADDVSLVDLDPNNPSVPAVVLEGKRSLVDLDPNNPSVPAVVLEGKRQKIWFKQDEEFRVPRGATYINFRSPEVGQTAGQSAAAVLYTSLLKDQVNEFAYPAFQVNEFAYPALLAGLSFNFYKHAQGISLRISGYDDKQAVLLQQLLEVLVEPVFDPQRFEDIRSDMIRNTVAKRPSSQVIDDLREALLYGEWGEQALIDELEQLDVKALEAYVAAFWRGATAEILLYGNYSPEVVQQVSGMVGEVVPVAPAPQLPEVRVLRLAGGESLRYQVDVPHDDSVVAWYLQGGDNSWADRAATLLTGQIMKSGFFQQLRTEQQLGYVVSAFSWPQRDVPGLVMLVQSPVADAPAVVEAMETFMQQVVPELDEGQFARHRAALLAEIRRPDKNMWERAEFYWQSIAKKQWDFDAREALAEAVEALTLESLQVVTPGKWKKFPEAESQVYDSAEAIKDGHTAYVID
jgi:secreted Zn-dependent insulinase-like peptidase